MTALLLGVFEAVVPFLGIFFFFVIFFTLMSAVLGNNRDLAESYVGAPLPVGYFFQTFENGIGNLSAPTINFLENKKNAKTPLDHFIVF